MKTRLPSRKNRPNYVAPDVRAIMTDVPYLTCILGYVFFFLPAAIFLNESPLSVLRGFFIFWGLFFPCEIFDHLRIKKDPHGCVLQVFYLQLFSVKHGVSSSLAFYCV